LNQELIMNNDWTRTFAPMVKAVLKGQNPYTSVHHYVNPPWLLLPLLPVFWAPWWLAMLFPTAVLVFGAWQHRKPWLIPIVGLSFPFIALSIYANVDWVVLLGLIIRGPAGPILVTAKPQAGAFSMLADLKERAGWYKRALFLLPFAIVVMVSTMIFPNWLFSMLDTPNLVPERNVSLFPYTIPFGLIALWLCWRRADPLWGVVASVSLSPYLYIHSVTPLLFLLADRDYRLGIAFGGLTWAVVLLSTFGAIHIAF
jgi:hypothetical protein